MRNDMTLFTLLMCFDDNDFSVTCDRKATAALASVLGWVTHENLDLTQLKSEKDEFAASSFGLEI